MAETQKLYLGDDEIGITRFGEDGNLIRGAFPFSLGIDYLVVGAGGGGGTRDGVEGGGGGAGRFLSQTANLATANTLSIVIGSGGSPNNNGGVTTLIGSGITQRMPGGGAGGSGINDDGNSGGSGGGGAKGIDADGGTAAGAGIGLSDDQGTGVNGSDGDANNAANGGGSATQWLDGITYAIGGARGDNGGTPETTKGSGGDGANDSGTISATSGQSGIVKIRYAGNQKATGGTITQDGGYTYHTFTGNGTFTVTG